MRKLMILSVPFLSIFLILLFTGLDTNAQTEQTAKNAINESNLKFEKWFNSGQIDSLGLLYSVNSCMIPANYKAIYGRENIKEYFRFLYNTGLRFNVSKTNELIISDSIAVERGAWSANSISDSQLLVTGNYITQWQLMNGEWYIKNEMSNSDATD